MHSTSVSIQCHNLLPLVKQFNCFFLLHNNSINTSRLTPGTTLRRELICGKSTRHCVTTTEPLEGKCGVFTFWFFFFISRKDPLKRLIHEKKQLHVEKYASSHDFSLFLLLLSRKLKIAFGVLEFFVIKLIHVWFPKLERSWSQVSVWGRFWYFLINWWSSF